MGRKPAHPTADHTLRQHDVHIDRYAEGTNNYENAGTVDPTGPTSGYMARVRRGGSWLEDPESCRSAHRNAGAAQGGIGRTDFIGFRVVFTGKVKGDKEFLEIPLPEKAGGNGPAQEQERETGIRGQAIGGVLRDEGDMPVDGVQIQIFPFRNWLLRQYAEGEFEASWNPRDSSESEKAGHLIARHVKRNLAVGIEIEEDVNELDIKLRPGVMHTASCSIRVNGSQHKT